MSRTASSAPGDLLYKLTARDPQPGASFGEVLVCVDGDILVGEPDRFLGDLPFVGQAYLFDGQTGALRSTFSDPEPINRSTFGASLAGGDGTIFIGSGALTSRSRVYSFDRSGQLRYTIHDPDPQGSAFGAQLAYSDGSLLASSPGYYMPGDLSFPVGRAHLFNSSDGQLRSLPNPEPKPADGFGTGVAVFGDKLAVGAILDDLPADNDPDGENPGRVWVFDRATGSVVFTIENPNPAGRFYDAFGFSLAGDDDILVVGANEDETNAVDGSGTVYVFDSRTGELRHTLFSPQPEVNGEFGRSVAVTPGGDILVGAWNTSVNNVVGAGRVYLFDGETGGLLLDIPNPDADLVFGWSVAAAGDRILVGAPAADVGPHADAGAVYVFEAIPEPSSLALLAAMLVFATAMQLLRQGRKKSSVA